MITLLFLLTFFGSFCFYHTSKKAMLSNSLSIEKWLQNNPITSKVIGLLLYVSSLVIACNNFGLTSGILYWFLLISLILSLLIIIAPTKKINYKHIILGFSILIIIQLAL